MLKKKELLYITNPCVAKELLLKGFSILDIEPNPQDKKATVFYFKNSILLKKVLKEEYNYHI